MKTRLHPLVISFLLLAAGSPLLTAAVPGMTVTLNPGGVNFVDGVTKFAFGASSWSQNLAQFKIKNIGTTPITMLGPGLTGPGAADYDYGFYNLEGPIAPGVVVDFYVELKANSYFTPTSLSHQATLSLNTNLGSFAILLTAPEIAVEFPVGNDLIDHGSSINFGQTIGVSANTVTVTVRNVGSATLNNVALGKDDGIDDGVYKPDLDYTVAGLDGHPKSLAPNASLTFTVKLNDKASGALSGHRARIYLSNTDYDEGQYNFHFYLKAPEITVESPTGTSLVDGTAEIDFSKLVGATPNRTTVTVKNTGSANLNIQNVVLSGAGAADYTLVLLPTMPIAVVPNGSTSFDVIFDPASSQGSHLADLDIISPDADETHFNIALKAPEISLEVSGRDLVDGGNFGFGTDQGDSRTVVFTIRNKGSAPLTNLAASLDGLNASEYTVFGPSVTTLAPNATTTFNVKFTPTGPGGRPAALHITSNDGDENPYDIHFREPKIQVELASGALLVKGTGVIDFGNLAGGPSNTVTLRIRNVGNSDLKELSVVTSGVDAADYTIGPLGATTLAPNAFTTFTVTLDSASQKTHLATLDILSNDEGASPFRLTLKAPEFTVERPVGANIADGSTTDFGTINTANSSTFTFTVKNKGSSSLTNLSATIDGANPLDFTLTGPAVTTLAPNATSTFTVKFAPLATGARGAALHLVNNDVDENAFDIALQGFGMAITLHPLPQLVGVGESAAFIVSAITNSQPPVFTWLKDGKPIPGAAHTAIYTIPIVALTHAGSYSCLVVDGTVSISSGKARLGVVGSATTAVMVNEGTTLALKVSESIPPGPAPTHQWKQGVTALTNGGAAPAQVISGATLGTLSITKAVAINDGSYTCVVGMDGLTKESGPLNVSVRLKPVIHAAGPFAWLVSGTVTDQITAANAPTSFTFTNLPAGVSGDKVTGQLSGKPTAATTANKTFTVTATNAAGTGPIATIGYTIEALPAASVGTFSGLVDRSTVLSGAVAGQFMKGHGGSLANLVVTSSGTFTATLNLEDKSYKMPAAARLDATAGGNPAASVVILRGTATDTVPDLTLAFAINKDTGELTGTLSDGVIVTPVALKAWRSPWKATGTVASPANPADAASYTAALELDPALAGTDPLSAPPGNPANVAYPQGTGYGTLTITTAGIATWSGKAADGTPLTASTMLGPNGEVPLHFLLYTPMAAATAGSLHGWIKITGVNLDSVAPFDWLKLAQLPANTTRSYKDGFPLHNLTVIGSKYVKPVSPNIVLGLGAPPDNTQLVFSEGGIKDSTLGVSGALTQIFDISTANAVDMPTGLVNNPGTVILKLDAATGAISGNFTLSGSPVRSVPWSGVLVPRLSKGVGQFQLAKLPNPTTSPQLSGQVVLEAKP